MVFRESLAAPSDQSGAGEVKRVVCILLALFFGLAAAFLLFMRYGVVAGEGDRGGL